MPEGDTIRRLATRIEHWVKGTQVVDFQTTEPHLRRDDIVERSVLGARAEGKNLIIDLSGDLSLHSHLQMRGKWRIERPPREAALDRVGARVHGEFRPAQLRLATSEVALVGLNLRIVRWLETRDTASIGLALGPDLLGRQFDEGAALLQLQKHADLPIAVALMRQDLVAGLGNVGKSETLFVEGLHPRTKVADLSEQQLVSLLQVSRKLLQRNLAAGPRRTRFSGGGPRLWVYERAGEHCLKCGEIIQMIRLGPKLRSTYFCPRCQPDHSRPSMSFDR